MVEVCCSAGALILVFLAIVWQDLTRRPTTQQPNTERGHWFRKSDGNLLAVPESRVEVAKISGLKYIEPYENHGDIIVSEGKYSNVRMRGDHVIVDDETIAAYDRVLCSGGMDE